MSTNDTEIWEAYAKTVKKTGIKKRASAVAPKNQKVKIDKPVKEKILAAIGTPKPPVIMPVLKTDNVTFERSRERALKDGDIRIDGRIDLHGMTQDTAYAALAGFMKQQIKAEKRLLLVITGKGSKGESVLKNSLPGWLETLASRQILTVRPAAAKHGGGGAFYVMLKKRKG